MSSKNIFLKIKKILFRESLLVLSKTSSGQARIEADINKHTMKGQVADRGGRVNEMAGPQRETFAQQE